jgi:hypothetical protein
MATPRGLLSIPVNVGSGEQYLVAASVPTLGQAAMIRVQGASIVWLDQPSTLVPSALSGSTGLLMTPGDPVFRFYGSIGNFRFRDLGAAGILVISFYEAGNLVGI